jgi:hypothetical protein
METKKEREDWVGCGCDERPECIHSEYWWMGYKAAQAAQGAPGTREAKDITLIKPDDMIDWLTDLNSNWAVLRNTRSFMEGQPKEYWKKFDICMGEAFKLQIALMKLRAAQPGAPTKGEK